MKWFISAMALSAGFLLVGCAHTKPKSKITISPPVPIKAIVTPDNSLAGTVVSYNSFGRFVVLNFPSHQLPNTDQRLFLYRNGLKVAEIRITGPQNEDNIVADIVSGNAQAGDEVRDQ